MYIHAKIICMYVAFSYTALTNKKNSFINLHESRDYFKKEREILIYEKCF